MFLMLNLQKIFQKFQKNGIPTINDFFNLEVVKKIGKDKVSLINASGVFSLRGAS